MESEGLIIVLYYSNTSVTNLGVDLLGLEYMSIFKPVTETKGMKYVDWLHLGYVLAL